MFRKEKKCKHKKTKTTALITPRGSGTRTTCVKCGETQSRMKW